MYRDQRFPASPSARRAATACLKQLSAPDVERACLDTSPYGAFRIISRILRQDAEIKEKVWVVEACEGSHSEAPVEAGREPPSASAWPFWLRNDPSQPKLPLLYLLKSESVAGLRAAMLEAQDGGIFLNAAETADSRWAKSVQPDVALWLGGSAQRIPYDPASGLETLAVVRAAMRRLYLDGRPAFIYLSLHDDKQSAPAPPRTLVHHAYKGMYRLSAARASARPRIRLLGAGRALGQVLRAADILRRDWQVESDIWSCPSYTGLARDGHAASHWNMLHPASRRKVPRVQACLGSGATPIIAVTGYGQHVARQIGEFVPARFVALGSDSNAGSNGSPEAEWIVAVTIKALADDGLVPAQWTREALQRYALTP